MLHKQSFEVLSWEFFFNIQVCRLHTSAKRLLVELLGYILHVNQTVIIGLFISI